MRRRAQPKDPYAAIVGSVVRTHRQNQGISLQAMAEAMGMSTSGWSRVETGTTVMVVAQLRKAARRLHLEPYEIMRVADALWETCERAAAPR
jgi:transcriptional regulator with XRE-family HTH domain